ncbi:MAG: 3-oxoadipate enol-lactonase [Acidimicrobiales bacterium]
MPAWLHHVAEGPEDAPVVVLSNSLGTTLGMWDPQVSALVERWRVVRYDQRGHGRSAVPPGPCSIADLGGDVLALLDSLGVDRVSFCGLSLGGMVGMWLAAHAPHRIDRLVLCCTSARLGPPEAWAERAATVLAEGMGAIAEATVGRWFTPSFRERAPRIVDGVRRMLLATSPQGYAACCRAIEAMDLRADLGSITAPTLVVAAADDPSTPPSHGEEIHGAVAGSRMVVLPSAAHLANLEQPGPFTAALLAHLEGGPAT